MTILEALRRVNAYPVPVGTLESIAITRGLEPTFMADSDVLHSSDFRLATADVFLWLSEAPSVSQDGISYSFSETQRKQLKSKAMALYSKYGDAVGEGENSGVVYGYKGSKL